MPSRRRTTPEAPGVVNRKRPASTCTKRYATNGTPRGQAESSYFAFACPVCDEGDARQKPDGSWNVGSFKAACPGGGECLRSLAAATGAPGGGALMADPARWLKDCRQPVSPSGPPERVSWSKVLGWRERLGTDADAQLVCRRWGLQRATWERYGLGVADWRGRRALAYPVVHGDTILTVKFRTLGEPWMLNGKEVTKLGLSASSAFYPSVPRTGRLYLAAGEKDALIARQHGLRNTLTATTGAHVRGELVARLRGRHVAVVFDRGEDQQAQRVAAKIQAAGGRAWVVDLPVRRQGEDLADWFVKYGGTAAELRRLATAAKEAR